MELGKESLIHLLFFSLSPTTYDPNLHHAVYLLFISLCCEGYEKGWEKKVG